MRHWCCNGSCTYSCNEYDKVEYDWRTLHFSCSVDPNRTNQKNVIRRWILLFFRLAEKKVFPKLKHLRRKFCSYWRDLRSTLRLLRAEDHHVPIGQTMIWYKSLRNGVVRSVIGFLSRGHLERSQKALWWTMQNVLPSVQNVWSRL